MINDFCDLIFVIHVPLFWKIYFEKILFEKYDCAKYDLKHREMKNMILISNLTPIQSCVYPI